MASQVSYIIQVRDKFQKNLSKFNKMIEKGNDKTKLLSANIQKMGKKAQELGAKLTTRVTLPLAAVATASIFAFSKLEKGLTDTLTLLSKKEIKEFSGDLNKAQSEAVKMGFSIDDVNGALFDTVSALGVSANTTKIFAEAQKLAIGGNASLNSSVAGLGKTLNIYGDEIKDVKTISNAFFTAQKIGITDVQKLADNFPKVAGAAKFAGLSMQEAASALAVFTKVMPNTEVAATSMSSVLKAITNPGKENAKIFRKLGITYGVAGVKQKGFSTVLKQIQKAMVNNADAVAKAIPEMQALKGIANLSAKSLELMDSTVVQMANDVKDGTGLTEAYNLQMKTMHQQLKLAKGSLTNASKLIGKELAPFVLAAAKNVKFLAEGFSNLSPFMKQTIIIIAGITAIAGPLIAIFGTLAIAGAAVGLSLGWLFSIPIIIGVIISAIVTLQKKFQLLTKIGSGIRNAFTRGVSSDINVNNKSELTTPKQQEVNFNGGLTVDVNGPGKISKSSGFGPNLGLNAATA